MAAHIASFWKRYEGPTWAVASIVYGWWGLLIWFHADVPWWLMIPLGAFVIAWHNSLQHETIHALVRVPRAMRFALGFPPLSLWIPYPVYCRNHRKHHRDTWLTDPLEDPESYYHREDAWLAYPRAIRAVYLFNQTLVGRLTVGPLLYLGSFVKEETLRVFAGDRSNATDWAWHAVSVGVLLFWIGGVAGMPLWQYLALVVYRGCALACYVHSANIASPSGLDTGRPSLKAASRSMCCFSTTICIWFTIFRRRCPGIGFRHFGASRVPNC